MTELTQAERAHLVAFRESRPDWPIFYVEERWGDEFPNDESSRSYPKAHPYLTGMQYVINRTPRQNGRKLLDIGSPLAQNVCMASIGFDLTVVDVRPHPDAEELGLKWVEASACNLPFEDASWDLMTSCWVMSHVGDQRYGDDFEIDGDLKMLGELTRVLKPGGTLILGVGLVDVECSMLFNIHRIYSWTWLHEQFGKVGLEVINQKDLPVSNDMFIDPTWSTSGTFRLARRSGYYGICTLRKQS